MIIKRLYSFKYALDGLTVAFRSQPNLWIHSFIATVAFVLGIFFKITYYEWLILIITIGLVITLELTNTAIETIVDAFVDTIHPGAKKAKDVAAAAVLTSSITALIVGIVIFIPYIHAYLYH